MAVQDGCFMRIMRGWEGAPLYSDHGRERAIRYMSSDEKPLDEREIEDHRFVSKAVGCRDSERKEGTCLSERGKTTGKKAEETPEEHDGEEGERARGGGLKKAVEEEEEDGKLVSGVCLSL